MNAAQGKRRRGAGFWALICLGATMFALMIAGLLGRRSRKGAERERTVEYHTAIG